MAATKILLKRGTLEDGIKHNFIPKPYELLVVVMPDSSIQHKMGDGKTSFAELPFLDGVPPYFRVYTGDKLMVEVISSCDTNSGDRS